MSLTSNSNSLTKKRTLHHNLSHRQMKDCNPSIRSVRKKIVCNKIRCNHWYCWYVGKNWLITCWANSWDISEIITGGWLTWWTDSWSMIINHADTSDQLDIDESWNRFIQDIILDDYWHISSMLTSVVDPNDADTSTWNELPIAWTNIEVWSDLRTVSLKDDIAVETINLNNLTSHTCNSSVKWRMYFNATDDTYYWCNWAWEWIPVSRIETRSWNDPTNLYDWRLWLRTDI